MELTRHNTAIVLDSTSDFPDAAGRFENMRVVPLYVRFGEQTYRDHVDMPPEEFYARLQTADELPTTSQPTPQDFVDTFEGLSAYDRIYVLALSEKLSGTYASASLAAAELGGDRVRLVDTEIASLSIAQLATAVERRLDRGTTDEEIGALVERFKRERGLVIVVDTLEYLQKGGRIGRGQALAGNLLNVKPILSVEDGVLVPVARVRGRKKALEEFARQFTAQTDDVAGLRVGIAHANAPEWVEVLADAVERARPQAELEFVANIGAVVGTHAGPGAAALFWLRDDPA